MLPSSTNPTRPYTTDTIDNLFYMTVVTHHLNPGNPEDIAFAQSRIRAETQAAEDVLHDLGVLSMYSSDSQAMGRIGDTVTTCWRTADKMKKLTGALDGDPPENDNERILRYLAKLTINPALTHGIAHLVGSLEPGKVADIVLWPTNTFGVKPKYVIKGGLDRLGDDGRPERLDPDARAGAAAADVRGPGRAVGRTSMTFVSQAARRGRCARTARRSTGGSSRCGTAAPSARLRWFATTRTPEISVDPETYQVSVDGRPATVDGRGRRCRCPSSTTSSDGGAAPPAPAQVWTGGGAPARRACCRSCS